jgi:hypothetical protein
MMHYADGSTRKFAKRERPALLLDEKGFPLVLYNGVQVRRVLSTVLSTVPSVFACIHQSFPRLSCPHLCASLSLYRTRTMVMVPHSRMIICMYVHVQAPGALYHCGGPWNVSAGQYHNGGDHDPKCHCWSFAQKTTHGDEQERRGGL